MRLSRQRGNILDIFFEAGKHLTIVELYDQVKKRHPKIGYATVYRTMHLIREAGLAEEMDLGEGARRFERKCGHEHHDHLICLKCGKYIEVLNPEIERLQNETAKKYQFELKEHKMYLYGVCKECRGKLEKVKKS